MKLRSRTRPPTSQTGYALILMVVALMGIGGGVIASFTTGVMQETQHQRYLHNQRILEDAKQALLMYAYNYPVNNPLRGPGRLPCPDMDNNGSPDPSFNCISGTAMVGRFPWADPGMNFYDARDASGARLWFAASRNVANTISPAINDVINSGTQGTITIQDRSGALLYDGSVNGVAAVIIAPGAPIDRNGVFQDRSVANGDLPFDTVADDDPGIIDADRYLDLFGVVDNADFVNGTANGFVTGPIDNRVSGVLQVNDQMIVITTAEVIAMAEKATLQAYRASINTYLSKVGCIDGIGATEAICLANGGVGWNPVYPWLYNYRDVANKAELSSYYPALADFDDEKDPDMDPDTDDGYLYNYGRIPSIFADYFTKVDSQAIETRLGGSMTLIDPGTPDTFTLTQLTCDLSCGTGGPRTFLRDPDPDVEGPVLNFESTQILTGVRFVDTDPGNPGDDVRIIATFPTPESIPFDLYFVGDHDSPGTVWTACPHPPPNSNPGGANELSDCEGLSSNHSILHLQGTIDFSDILDQEFDFDNTTPPTIAWIRATGAAHAWITGTYPAAGIVSFPGVISTVTYEYDGHWLIGDTSINNDNNSYATGTVDMTGFNLDSLTLGMRYYPELPGWALDNGWHDSIRMAYADNYLPSTAIDCVPGNNCLSLPEERGGPSNIASLLVIAGEHDWIDNECPAACDGMADELSDVFDNGNDINGGSFYNKRSISPANSIRGNDKILVIEEL